MTANIKLKEAYEVESKHGAFYTGGNVEWHNTTIFCQTTTAICLLNTEDGTVTKTIGDDTATTTTTEDADILQTFTTNGEDKIISSHKSGLLKLWNMNGELIKMWKYIHKGPIAKLALHNNILASGGADGSIRVWDIDHQTCTLHLRGCQGVVNVVAFHNQDTIFGSGDDGKLHTWTNGTNAITYHGHYSKITSLVFAHDNKHFITSGRDKVIILWQYNQIKAVRTIAISEAVEVILGLPEKFKLPNFKADPECIYVASAGEFGIVRVWDVIKAKEVYQQDNSMVAKAEDGGVAITHLLGNDKSIAVVSADHNIIIHLLKSFVCLKQFIGFSDEILDITYVGKDDSYIAVATNSCDIKLYDNCMNCRLLRGHTDIVLALSTNKSNPDLMLSSSKDNRVRLWFFSGVTMTCIGVGFRHTASVGALAFSNLTTNFFVTGSQDTSIKLWETPTDLTPNEPTMMISTVTQMAHQKDINCIAIAPNDKIIATASQDKTVKLWTDSLTFIGTLRGHRRGVWSVKFSPIDQVIITSSADCTMKLWSVADMTCLKTFEGHESSVLRAEFISNGMQVISAGADGLLKLFNVKNSECVGVFEHHEARIWAMAIKQDESQLVTGGSDSVLIKWHDVTEARQLQRKQEEEENVLQQQKLANYVQNQQLFKALKLALRLNLPMQALKIVQSILKNGDQMGLADTVRSLKSDSKEQLLKCAVQWNTNSKHCQAAQLVLNCLINELQGGDFKPLGLSSMVEGALPYTERHFKRLTELLQNLHLINYTISCMQPMIVEK